MTFINKVVIITGAASGIGQAIASHFAKLSARLYLIDKDGESLKKTVEQCEKLCHTKVFFAVADLCRDELVERVVNDVKKQFGKIDVIINCAGIYKTCKILDSNVIDIFDKIMSVNLRSIVSITNRAAPILAESQGCIVNICSVSSLLPTSETFAYNVSKSSLNHFSKCVALELASKGVRVNCISPGPVSTNFLKNAGMSSEKSESFWRTAGNNTPLKHCVKVEELAELAAFLASDKAKSMTGGNYLVDCGLSLLGNQDFGDANKKV